MLDKALKDIIGVSASPLTIAVPNLFAILLWSSRADLPLDHSVQEMNYCIILLQLFVSTETFSVLFQSLFSCVWGGGLNDSFQNSLLYRWLNVIILFFVSYLILKNILIGPYRFFHWYGNYDNTNIPSTFLSCIFYAIC